MTLVEWTRLEPGQVEAVVAMLVNRERPTSVRITPSRGDGGVDILDRGTGEGGGDVVYQVKSYTKGLDKRQRDSIEDSLNTLGTDARWQGLDVVDWRLVTPWNPSPEAENWLHDLGSAADIQTVWHGMDFVEQLAAKYADVIDYYLRGGGARIKAAQAEVLTLLGLDHLEKPTSLHEVTGRVQHALGVLAHDPHYRFEFRFGEETPPPPPAPGDRRGLVMHLMQSSGTAGRWIAIDVIARCAASVDVQPITISGSIRVEPDTELARDWEAFVTYGAPFTAPEGVFTGEIVAPGELGGPLENAIVKTGPTADADLGENPEMHVDLLDPDGHVLASAEVDRVERSQGIGGGIRVVLREVHGMFELEERWNLKAMTESRHLRVSEFAGLPVGVSLDGVRFLSGLHAPNRIRLSPRHAPPERGVIDAHVGFDWDESQLQALEATRRILETLTQLQAHTSTVIRTPDFRHGAARAVPALADRGGVASGRGDHRDLRRRARPAGRFGVRGECRRHVRSLTAARSARR